MRIVGGAFGGRRLAALGKGDAGAHLRPTTDRVREAMFNMLGGGRFGAPFEGAQVLDLFAGTGALGLEALSRGARRVTFVDNGRVAQRLLRDNIATLGVADRCQVVQRSALRLPPAQSAAVNDEAQSAASLVFLDPPYGRDLGGAALRAALEQGWIAPKALIVWEEATPQAPPDGFAFLETRAYGDTVVTLLEAAQ